MEGVLQSTIKVPNPLAARCRGAEGRIVEDNVHRRDITVLSRIEAAVRANHILLTAIRQSHDVSRSFSRRWLIKHGRRIDRKVVGRTDIKFLSARREILAAVKIVIDKHIAPGDMGFYLGLYRTVAPGRTEARGLDRSVLCDQCRSA